MRSVRKPKLTLKNHRKTLGFLGVFLRKSRKPLKNLDFGDFNTEEFWEDMRVLSKNNDVYISEYSAPEDFECVLEIPTKTIIRDSNDKVSYRVEKLFTYKK